MTMRFFGFVLAVFSTAAYAQLAPLNSAGVAMREVDLNVSDIPASIQYFETLGGHSLKTGATETVEFPGVYINLHKQEPTGGTAGSTLDHIGFHVRNIDEVLATLTSHGYTVEPGTRPTQRIVLSPDKMRIEVFATPTLEVPIRFYHVHYFVSDPAAAQAWYGKNFGAAPSQRGEPPFQTANLPGVELGFSPLSKPLLPTRGRAADHIGFEVKNIAEFRKKLEAEGVVFDGPVRKASHGAKVTFFTDPWGNYIELTEGASSL
jgi:catechol 2,3-dioxygenase-like lactoylglutathione lyase family enzyme